MKLPFLLVVMLTMPAIGCQKPTSKPVGPPIYVGNSRTVKFDSHGLMLEGTLQLPVGATGKVPAVLLLPGSGPTDRDGNSGLGITTDILKQIAEELAKNGIASLRFDKRAIKIYAAKWPKDVKEMSMFFSWENFVDDASAGFDFMAMQSEIDPIRMGILGHSEGALLSLQIGSNRNGKSNAPKATILMGSTGRPMGAVIHDQIARRLKEQGAPADVTKVYLDYVDNACKALIEGKGLPKNPPTGLESLFNPTSYYLMSSYCRIDPADLAKKVNGPVLVLNGKNDAQVSAVKDTPRLLDALKARSGQKLESLIVPDTSHNFKSTKGATDDAFTGSIVSDALALILKFAKANL